MLLFVESVLIVAITVVFFKIIISVINDQREIKPQSKKSKSGVEVTPNSVDDDGIVESTQDKCASNQFSNGSRGSLDIDEDDAVSGEAVAADSRDKYVQTSSDESFGVCECKETSINESPERVNLNEIEVDSVNDDEVRVVKSEETQVSDGDEIDGFVRERLLDESQCKETYIAESPANLNLDEIEVDSINDDGVCVDKSEEIQVCVDDEVGDSLGLISGGGEDEIGVIMDNVVVKETLLDEEDDWEGIERTDLEKVFGAAVVYLASRSNADPVSSLGSDAKMRFYGLHKVATEGPCHLPQPMVFKVSARAKWTEGEEEKHGVCGETTQFTKQENELKETVNDNRIE
ncbi:acyl-CoA-binding domain-containing protein 3-like isoform X2 [Tripterygium wilfordii]|uniref:acyl-CoA-binding domain-containing protein 3-like isoform X2 n=1 Tax=Tripterygium wilfordii TaxID=458696 RepID=UPI0018F80859|nr:acyl-CoA-binding domain-containing protein 3-like isoform X2 [Tripterygium wilfordii]